MSMAELPPTAMLQLSASRRESRATKGGTASREAANHTHESAAVACSRGMRPS